MLLRDHGTWEVADVLAYAIGYARDGHPLLAQASATIGRVAGLFTEHWPTSAALWMPDGEVPEAGTIVRNPAYAAVLESPRRRRARDPRRRPRGPRSADRGCAARVEDRRRRPGRGILPRDRRTAIRTARDHAGVITAEDFAAFDAGYEPAVSIDFRGHTIAKAGAWTQGPALLQTLRILDGCANIDPSTEAGAHTVLEALKLALADRDAYYGDGDVPLELAAVGGVRGHATRSDRRLGIARMATRRGSRTRAVPPPAHARPPAAGPASRRSASRAAPAATRATSTSWIAGAT